MRPFLGVQLHLAILRWSRSLMSESPANPGRSTVPTAWEREQARALRERHLAEREAETSRLNKLIEWQLDNLDNILSVGILRNVILDHNARKLPFPVFDAGELDTPYAEPTPEGFLPPEPGALMRMVPGWRGRYEAQLMRAEEGLTPPMRSGNNLRKTEKSRQDSSLHVIRDINKRSARCKRNTCAWMSSRQTQGQASSTRLKTMFVTR